MRRVSPGSRALSPTFLVVAALAWPLTAHAGEDLAAAEKELAEAESTLSTSDCAIACRALASIRRAADKICAIEPGSPRCDAARTKERDATRRVRASCPDCAIAFAEMAPDERERPVAKAETSYAPPSEQRGGCRSCAAGGDGRSDLAGLGLVVALTAWAARRRRRA